jgi:hypothetical protein
LLGKYGRGREVKEGLVAHQADSNLWKTLVTLWPKLQEYVYWAVGNGRSINVWNDRWIDEGIRICDVVEHIPEAIKGWKIADIIDETGSWNFDMLHQFFPDTLLQKLYAIVPPHDTNGDDVMLWPGNNLGQFTVSSAYNKLECGMRMSAQHTDQLWTKIWRIPSLERVRVFMWLIKHDRILTNFRLARWGLRNAYCDHCGQFEETTIHVLRDCSFASTIWRHLIDYSQRGEFFLGTLQSWIDMNMSRQLGRSNSLPWDAVWSTTCYWLWRWRNQIKEHMILILIFHYSRGITS